MTYTEIEGIKCYAPELAFENNGLPSEAFDRVFESETKNFWFLARSRIFQYLFDRYASRTSKTFLEIGCGTGSVLADLHRRFPAINMTGGEIYLSAIKFARKRLPEIEFIQCDSLRLPFCNRFDSIGLFDVLEHIEDDQTVIHNAHKALTDNGILFVSVPQHRFLWSANDDVAFHKRRYTRRDLIHKITQSGFTVLFASSFVSLLFPLLWIVRLIKRTPATHDPYQAVTKELNLPPPINFLLNEFMKVDEFCIKRGFSLPFGGSLCLVAKKTSHT